jgi:excinuclease ABC subunit A
VKLASNIDVNRDGHTLFVFDEPTTGLHVHDVSYLLAAFDTLVDAGNSVLIIEHNLHVIASADYVIDLGPEGGSGGGYIIATGTPRQVSKVANSYTGHALKAYFAELGVQRESVV